MRRLLRKVSGFLLGNPWVVYQLDKLLFRPVPPNPADPKVLLVLAPPGGGNNGDLAMVQTILEQAADPVVLIVRNRSDYDTGLAPAPLEVVSLEGLVYGGLLGHLRELKAFSRLLASAKAFAVVGADIMDGAYNPTASWRRSLLLRLAIRAGVKARVFGFSWNASPEPAALSMLKKAAREGAVLCPRDPESFGRLDENGVPNLVQVADLVFSSSTRTPLAEVPLPQGFRLDRPFVVVNVSGLIDRKLQQAAEYSGLFENLRRAQVQILLLPHVIKKNSDDREACARVLQTAGSDSVYFVEHILPPAVLRSLASQALAVVTGRMHLSILALSVGCPAVVLATQGKVEGLLGFFGMREFCIEPTRGFGYTLNESVQSLLRNRDRFAEAILQTLPVVVSLSKKNFESL